MKINSAGLGSFFYLQEQETDKSLKRTNIKNVWFQGLFPPARGERTAKGISRKPICRKPNRDCTPSRAHRTP